MQPNQHLKHFVSEANFSRVENLEMGQFGVLELTMYVNLKM